MSDQVWWVKLVTGEDLFARLIPAFEGVLALEDPMVLEMVESAQAGRHILMTRYAPFITTPLLVSVRDAVICQPVNKTMTDYYVGCLDFHEKEADEKLERAVTKATRNMTQDNLESIDDWNERVLLSSLASITDTKN